MHNSSIKTSKRRIRDPETKHGLNTCPSEDQYGEVFMNFIYIYQVFTGILNLNMASSSHVNMWSGNMS